MLTKRHPIHAAGAVNGADAAILSGCRFVNPARTAAGKYTLTLAEPLDAAQGCAVFTPRSATDDASISYVWTSDTVLTVETFTAGVAADHSFDFIVVNLV